MNIADLTITPFYIGVNAILLLALSYSVIRIRVRKRITIGDSGDLALQRRIRAHANYAEHMPVVLLLLGALELLAANGTALWIIGGIVTVGRVLHATGLGANEGASFGRMFGHGMTLLFLLLGGGWCIYLSLA